MNDKLSWIPYYEPFDVCSSLSHRLSDGTWSNSSHKWICDNSGASVQYFEYNASDCDEDHIKSSTKYTYNNVDGISWNCDGIDCYIKYKRYETVANCVNYGNESVYELAQVVSSCYIDPIDTTASGYDSNEDRIGSAYGFCDDESFRAVYFNDEECCTLDTASGGAENIPNWNFIFSQGCNEENLVGSSEVNQWAYYEIRECNMPSLANSVSVFTTNPDDTCDAKGNPASISGLVSNDVTRHDLVLFCVFSSVFIAIWLA